MVLYYVLTLGGLPEALVIDMQAPSRGGEELHPCLKVAAYAPRGVLCGILIRRRHHLALVGALRLWMLYTGWALWAWEERSAGYVAVVVVAAIVVMVVISAIAALAMPSPSRGF